MDNQFAYKVNSSTTCALIALLTHVTELLKQHKFVSIISFDYSKAFDTLSHNALAKTLFELNIDPNIYNWVLDYLSGRSHVTEFNNSMSSSESINAFIVQGSVLGPSLFNITSSSLKPLYDVNRYFKYADDGYLVVPEKFYHTIQAEIAHHSSWAQSSNLKLNLSKTQEMILCNRKTSLPQKITDVERVRSMKILGVILDDKLKFQEHINKVISNTSQCYFALRTLRYHGMSQENLCNIFKATIIPKMLYAIPSFWGFLSMANKLQLQAVLNRAIKLNYYKETDSNIEQIVNKMELDLYTKINENENHILHHLLPENKSYQYNLRYKQEYILPDKDNRQFIPRMLYRNLHV